jgi:hypothetical protein
MTKPWQAHLKGGPHDGRTLSSTTTGAPEQLEPPMSGTGRYYIVGGSGFRDNDGTAHWDYEYSHEPKGSA